MDDSSAAAIVTGAGRGLGFGIASALAGAGHPVVLAGRDRDELASAARAIGSRDTLVVAADVTDPADVGRLVQDARERFGGVGVVVNNAGAPPALEPLDALSWESFRRCMETDVGGTFKVTRAAAQLLRADGRATVVNVAAAAGGTVASPRHIAYSPSQAALLSLSRCLGAAMAADGVAVHCLCPSLTTAGGVGRTAAATFASAEGLVADQWIERRLGAPAISAAGVGAAVVALLARRTSNVWTLDAKGLSCWPPIGPPDPERDADDPRTSPEEAE